MVDHTVDWQRCKDGGCNGVRLPSGVRCWAHATETDLNSALKCLGEHGHVDARGVPITQQLLGRLLAAAPQDNHGHAILTDVKFDRATFQDNAEFSGTTFQGVARFDGATFQSDADFGGATFQGTARFEHATFQENTNFSRATFQEAAEFGGTAIQEDAGFVEATFQQNAAFHLAAFQHHAWFDGAIFQGAALFEGAAFKHNAAFRKAAFKQRADFAQLTFQGGASFDEATFQEDAWFMGTTFQKDAWFRRATFQRDALFDLATFQDAARFDRATFQDAARFDRATFQTVAQFDEAIFQQARQLGPMLVHRQLTLDGAAFHERPKIEASALAVCCRRTRFLAGVQLRVRWAQVVLDETDLAAPSILTSTPAFQGLREGRWTRAVERLQAVGVRAGQPRLISVRRADVGGLTVAGVDLRACRFAGAHHLDRLRIEESDFASSPRSWRWTARQTIAEEHHWRAAQLQPNGHDTIPGAATPITAARAGWYFRAHRPPAWLDVQPPTPAQVAALYRALRKGREENKDEPGAADFYYGEMEMRRHAKRTQAKSEVRRRHYGPWAAATTERAVLWLYWLISGYGLRAWRAMAAFAVVIGLVGVGFSQVGFHHPHPSQAVSWLYALQATVSLEGKARQLSGQLTLPGELLRVGLRFTGPVLLGLALLSIRGRVKR